MHEEKSLDDFFLNKTVTPVSKAADIDKAESHLIFYGAHGCPHSQLGTAHFSEACSAPSLSGDERVCYGLDVSKEEGGKIARELGIPKVGGVPAVFRWDKDKQKYQILATGRRMSHEYDAIFKDTEGI